MDWVSEFNSSPSVMLLSTTLDKAFADDYLEVDAAWEILAASEILAAAKGKPSSDFPEGINNSLLDISGAEFLKGKATKAIEKILTAGESELLELWYDEEVEDWKNVLSDLKLRLIE